MILVTGATGYVGNAALRRLAAMDLPVSALARSAEKAETSLPAGIPVRIADYDDTASLRKAMQGVDRLLFVASDGDGRDVMRHHANIIDAATRRGIGHVTFISITDLDDASRFYFAPVYRDAERRLAESGLKRTILRCGLYSDLILANWLEPALAGGKVLLPLGTARVAPISRDDVAYAAASAASAGRGGEIYHLTGPQAHSFDEITEIASSVYGIPLRYVPCAPADYLHRAWNEMPDPWPHAFSTLCASIAEGRYGEVSADFRTLTGRSSESFEDFFRRKAELA